MAHSSTPQNDDSKSCKPYVSTNIKHRTVTLNGIHNKNKALYRLGVTADEIHRSKALLTLGGTEDTYHNTLQYYSHNHHPQASSVSFLTRKNTKTNITNITNRLPPQKVDPLEHEYTHNSQTQETIEQSFLDSISKRESNSFTNSITLNNQLHKHEEKKSDDSLNNTLIKSALSSDSDIDSDNYIDDSDNEHSSENEHPDNDKNRKYVRQNPHINKNKNKNKNKKVIIPGSYNNNNRKYKSKKDNNNNNNNNNITPLNDNNTTPKDWIQFYESKAEIEHKINKYSHPTKYLSSPKDIKKNTKIFDLNNDFTLEENKRKKSWKSEKKLRKPNLNKKDKKTERDRWNANRIARGYHDNTSDVINSSQKVKKFFGDDPSTNNKLNWKLGETVDQMMDMRSIDIVSIVSRDEQIRKKEKKQFTRKAKLIRKLSSIKLRFGSNKNGSNRNDSDAIENKNFLSNSSFSDFENDKICTSDGNESNASTQSTKSNTDTDNDNPIPNSMIIYPYNNGLQHGTKQDINKKKKTKINGIRNGKNGGYHIDQSLFTFQNPNKTGQNVINKQRASSYLQKRSKKNLGIYVSKSRSPSPGGKGNTGRFYRKKKKSKNANRYGFKTNGKINMLDMNSQIPGLRKLLCEKKTLSEIISIYYSQYGFCVDFIVSLVSSIDMICPIYITTVSRHVDKQIKILHNLSLWQYILRVQMVHIDIQRFFYSFGPLIGKYKTLISPLHLTARKLIEIGGRNETHITLQTSTPECVYAFETFKWLLFIGYDINDGDVENTVTPQTILNHAPRILKQILAYQRQFLFKQRKCMEIVDSTTYKQYKILLDDDILQVIEKFTYNKYRKSRAGFEHKKFVK